MFHQGASPSTLASLASPSPSIWSEGIAIINTDILNFVFTINLEQGDNIGIFDPPSSSIWSGGRAGRRVINDIYMQQQPLLHHILQVCGRFCQKHQPRRAGEECIGQAIYPKVQPYLAPMSESF
jgi:hypothetical protein